VFLCAYGGEAVTPFEAKYRGQCGLGCSVGVSVGELVIYEQGVLIHDECPVESDKEGVK
jgi:hypothetical protein